MTIEVNLAMLLFAVSIILFMLLFFAHLITGLIKTQKELRSNIKLEQEITDNLRDEYLATDSDLKKARAATEANANLSHAYRNKYEFTIHAVKKSVQKLQDRGFKRKNVILDNTPAFKRLKNLLDGNTSSC